MPAGLTLLDGPGGRSWTRLLRTPIGGGGLLSQNFPLRRPAGVAPAAVPAAPPERTATGLLPDEPDAGVVPPRRTYESRQGSSLLIALGEVSFGRAAQEFELFEKDDDVWGYGSIFYQGALGSPKNRLTFAADSRRRLNGTTDRDRLFELDPNDRQYPLFGDASLREEFATSNSKVFARLERGASYGMWGDLIGDLPSSDRDGGRWSSYQRHLTGAEFRLAGASGNHVTIRGAQPETAYAREVFAGGAVGWLTLRHPELLAGTETVAIEVRDRRMPERVLSRDVLRRGVDYQVEPATGTVYLQRHVSGLDPLLNLVQVVITYEYESAGLDQLVFGGRASATMSGLRIGGTFFTEEGQGDSRFTVGGVRSRSAAAAQRAAAARGPVQHRHAGGRVQRGFATGGSECAGGGLRRAGRSRAAVRLLERRGARRLSPGRQRLPQPVQRDDHPGRDIRGRVGRAVSVHELARPLRRHVRARRRADAWTRAARRCPVNGRNRSVAA